MIDAFGKPPSGLLQGDLTWAGEYSECVNTTHDEWIGKYCYVSKPVQQGTLIPSFIAFVCY